MPRKRLITKVADPASAKIKNGHTTLKNLNMKYESNQQLADLQVECLNKDKTIQEHERHIEEMKEDMRKLEAEIDLLQKKQKEIEIQHSEDIEAMVNILFSNKEVTCYLMLILLCYLLISILSCFFFIYRLNCNRK